MSSDRTAQNQWLTRRLRRGIITPYLILRYVVRSGFPNTYRVKLRNAADSHGLTKYPLRPTTGLLNRDSSGLPVIRLRSGASAHRASLNGGVQVRLLCVFDAHLT
jgi:hypothetical protein